jgi:hypothetical protein
MLGLTMAELEELDYDEVLDWFEFFRRRPYGWRDDNRAAVVAMSMAGSKIKPEDLFESLKILKEESIEQSKKSFAVSFVEKFAGKFTERPEFLSNDKN